MTDLRDYIREEIEEESRLGYLSEAEGERRKGLLDGTVTASSGGGSAEAADDSVGDGTVVAAWTEIEGANGPLSVYLARPAARESAPGVIVIHENKGLVPYVRDVARRFAAAGFVALAPDLLSSAGGTRSFADPAEATAAIGKIAPEDHVAELKAAVTHLANDAGVTEASVGVVGFCFGGGLAWRLITQDQRLRAAVPFYGPNPPLADVANIDTPVFAIYGELDARITGGLPDIEAAMNAAGKPFDHIVLAGAQHAFHNDTNPERYNAEAAGVAWAAALEHLSKWLG